MQLIEQNGCKIAIVEPSERIVSAQDALDVMVSAQYNHAVDALVFYAQSLPEAFFDLKTGLAGEILQKFSNYRMRLSIVGDFSGYHSKALRDFIYECNQGRTVNWSGTLDAALHALAVRT